MAAQPPAWMIVNRRARVNVVAARGGADADTDTSEFRSVFAAVPPPGVCVPRLELPAGTKNEADPDPRIVSFTSFGVPMTLLEYPPVAVVGRRNLAPRRYVVENHGRAGYVDPDEEGASFFPELYSRTEIRGFPAGYFDNVKMPGVVAHPTELGRYAVVDLRARVDNGRPVRDIVYIVHDSTTPYARDGDWTVASLPGRLDDIHWNFDDVISVSSSADEQAFLAWFDGRQGIFTVDPFVENPKVKHFPLPPVHPPFEAIAIEVSRGAFRIAENPSYERSIQFSRGRFRLVEIWCRGTATKIIVQTLDSDTGAWEQDYTFDFREIWFTPYFMASGIPWVRSSAVLPAEEGAPRFALMGGNVEELFFFASRHGTTWLYRVDGPSKTLVDFKVMGEEDGLDGNADFRSVRPWRHDADA